jgi:hypothetical protein
LRRSPQPLEADLEHPRSGVLNLRSARSSTGPRRRLNGRSRRVGGFRYERRDRGLSRCGFGACRTSPCHVVLDFSTRWAPTVGGNRPRRVDADTTAPRVPLFSSATATRLFL